MEKETFQDTGRPYIEEGEIREFNDDVTQDDLVWHRDREDREVEVVGETNWMFQFDNELPFIMEGKFTIPMGVYHRVIKGDGDLKLKIKKF